MCPAGQISSDGLSPCTECPLGTYQPNSMRVVCYPCPGGGRFGGNAGAISVAECPSMSCIHCKHTFISYTHKIYNDIQRLQRDTIGNMDTYIATL